jgi:hypothetical protein
MDTFFIVYILYDFSGYIAKYEHRRYLDDLPFFLMMLSLKIAKIFVNKFNQNLAIK